MQLLRSANFDRASVFSSLAYSACSISMVLSNKALVSYAPAGSESNNTFFLMVLQALAAVLLCLAGRQTGSLEVDPFVRSKALKWLPLNLLFVGMLFSGFISLRYAQVPIVTVFKNLTNIITLIGDYYFNNQNITFRITLAAFIIVLGAVLAAYTDLELTPLGTFWMSANCVLTSAYVLFMRHVTQSVNLSRFGMVYYNNLLSLPIFLALSFCFGELSHSLLVQFSDLKFCLLNLFAGAVGFLLNSSSLWCVSTTSATTYAILGSLNKVPLVVLGVILFKSELTFKNTIFITLSILGGLIYSLEKLKK